MGWWARGQAAMRVLARDGLRRVTASFPVRNCVCVEGRRKVCMRVWVEGARDEGGREGESVEWKVCVEREKWEEEEEKVKEEKEK